METLPKRELHSGMSELTLMDYYLILCYSVMMAGFWIYRYVFHYVINLVSGLSSCGQVQSGSFLDSAAPNGLLGLGLEKISVPSILASSGLISNSFSMCFGLDGIGRISFGDKGSSDQDETPFSIDQLQ